MLATTLLLQTHDRVSNEEAASRAAFDLRWKVALGVGLEERPFAKSTLQLFRAQLVVHQQIQAIFKRSLTFARQTGYLKGGSMRVALDTSAILRRGAVKDTYNLLADGIVKLVRVLARLDQTDSTAWASARSLERYLGTRLRGNGLGGQGPDFEQTKDLVEQSETNAQAEVVEAIGDCAHGEGGTRQEFADAERKLVAKVPPRPNRTFFAKEDFPIKVAAQTCTCPAGHACSTVVTLGSQRDRHGKTLVIRGFQSAAELCAACRLRPQCVKAGPAKGRTVRLHPQEALLQEGRAFQKSAGFAPYRQLRQTAEHRIARLMQLGVRQACYHGRVRTLGQLLLAATLANLTLVATRIGLLGDQAHGHAHSVSIIAPTSHGWIFGRASRAKRGRRGGHSTANFGGKWGISGRAGRHSYQECRPAD